MKEFWDVVQGKGVFVVGDKYEENLDEHGGFVNVMSSGTKRVSIKEKVKIYRPAGNKYANYFNIEPDDLIFLCTTSNNFW